MCIVEVKQNTNYLLTTCYRTGEYFRNTILTDNVLRGEDNVQDVKKFAFCMTRRHVSRLWQHKSCYGKRCRLLQEQRVAGLMPRLDKRSGSDHQGSRRRSHVEWGRSRAIFTPDFVVKLVNSSPLSWTWHLLNCYCHSGTGCRDAVVVAAAGGHTDY